jgi:hypothetical protein
MITKKWVVFSSFMLFISLCTCVNSLYAIHDLQIHYQVKGIHHTLNNGISKLEFNEILLTTNHDLKIEKFRITLSRGNRAVKTMDVHGDRFDLRKFTGVVRSGDYIVIEIKKFSEKQDDACAFFKAIKVN